MKKCSIIWILITLSVSALAQRDSNVKKVIGPKSIAISVGVGASTIGVLVEDPFDLAGSGVSIISVKPSYNIMLDYNDTRKSGAGIAIAYQQLSYLKAYNGGNQADYFLVNASRLNVGIRFLWHFSKISHSDFYMGFRLGVSYWQYNESLNPNFHFGPYTYVPTPASPWTKTDPSVQLLLGYKGYLSEHIGLHIEAGLGTPYYAEGGLTYRFYAQR